jgi:hypothetical protein
MIIPKEEGVSMNLKKKFKTGMKMMKGMGKRREYGRQAPGW